MGVINCLCLLLLSSAALGHCAVIPNNAVNPCSEDQSNSPTLLLLLLSSTVTAATATEDNNQTRARVDDENDQNSSLHQNLSSTAEEEEKQSTSEATIESRRELQGVISNIVSQIRPPQVSNALATQSYDPRQQQQASRVGILKTDNRQATNNQDNRNLVRNVVSTVSNAAANIGTIVMGSNSKSSNSNSPSAGGLLQGRVIERVMGGPSRSGYGGYDQKSGGLVGAVAELKDNLLDGRPLIGKLVGKERRGGGLLG